MSFVILEGLDGVGKTYQIRKVMDYLYEKHGWKSFTISPLDFDPAFRLLIESPDYQTVDGFCEILTLHEQLINRLKKDYAQFDFIFLDRSFYSGFVYSLFKASPDELEMSLAYLKSVEDRTKDVHKYYLSVPEVLRKEYLFRKPKTKLFDDCDSETNKQISNCFDFLIKRTKLKQTSNFFTTFTGEKNEQTK